MLDAIGVERGDREGADVERQLRGGQGEAQVAVGAKLTDAAGGRLAHDAGRGHAGLAVDHVREVDRGEADGLGLDLVGEATQDHARGLRALGVHGVEVADDDAGQDLERDVGGGRLDALLGVVGRVVDGGDGALEGAELIAGGGERDLERAELGPDHLVAVFPVRPELHRYRVAGAGLGVVLAVQPDLGVAVGRVEEVATDDVDLLAHRDLGAGQPQHQRRVGRRVGDLGGTAWRDHRETENKRQSDSVDTHWWLPGPGWDARGGPACSQLAHFGSVCDPAHWLAGFPASWRARAPEWDGGIRHHRQSICQPLE